MRSVSCYDDLVLRGDFRREREEGLLGLAGESSRVDFGVGGGAQGASATLRIISRYSTRPSSTFTGRLS